MRHATTGPANLAESEGSESSLAARRLLSRMPGSASTPDNSPQGSSAMQAFLSNFPPILAAVSGLWAFLAGFFWLRSATVGGPLRVTLQDISVIWSGIGGTQKDVGDSDDSRFVIAAQAQFNKLAAFSAFVSSISQVGAIYLKLYLEGHF